MSLLYFINHKHHNIIHDILIRIGNGLIEYRQPINVLDWPSNIETGLCWYQNNNEPMWTYDLTSYLMVGLETNKCNICNDLYYRKKFV
jgi:hypothetical protein